MKIRTELILGFQNLFFWNLKQKWKVGNSIDSVFFWCLWKHLLLWTKARFAFFFPFLARFANNLCWNFSFYCQDACLELRIRFWLPPNSKMWSIWLKFLGFDALCNLVKLNGFSCYWLWYNLVDYCLVWLIDYLTDLTLVLELFAFSPLIFQNLLIWFLFWCEHLEILNLSMFMFCMFSNGQLQHLVEKLKHVCHFIFNYC